MTWSCESRIVFRWSRWLICWDSPLLLQSAIFVHMRNSGCHEHFYPAHIHVSHTVYDYECGHHDNALTMGLWRRGQAPSRRPLHPEITDTRQQVGCRPRPCLVLVYPAWNAHQLTVLPTCECLPRAKLGPDISRGQGWFGWWRTFYYGSQCVCFVLLSLLTCGWLT